jgi:hypothetical protein
MLKQSETNEFLKSIIQQANGHDYCQVKIFNGAHSTLGKLLTKLCNRRASEKEKTKKQSRHKYESVRGDDFQSTKDDADISIDGEEAEEDRETNYLIPFENEHPFKREYIMRASAPRPAPYSRQSPQRMYCMINNLEFRLAGAFTEDTMFF